MKRFHRRAPSDVTNQREFKHSPCKTLAFKRRFMHPISWLFETSSFKSSFPLLVLTEQQASPDLLMRRYPRRLSMH